MASPEELRRHSASPQLEIAGRGFSGEVKALLERNPEVQSVTVLGGRMVVAPRKEDVEVWRLVRTLVNAGVEIEEVRRSRPSLEETFLALVEDESQDEKRGGNDDQ